MEDGVNGVERPVLVEDDLIREEVLSIKHHACMVKVVKSVLPGDDASGFVAESTELVESESPMASLLGCALLVLASPFVEPAANLCTSLANLVSTVLFEEVTDGVVEMAFEGVSPKIRLGAVGAAFEEPEAIWP